MTHQRTGGRLLAVMRMAGAQAAGLGLVVFAAWAGKQIGAQTPLVVLVAGQAVAAVGIGYVVGLRGGWIWLQGGLAFLVWLFLVLALPPWVYLGAVLALALMYPNTLVERVPLYLTNRTTLAAVSQLLVAKHPGPGKFVDLGCGLGGTIAYLAKTHPDWHFVGVENAPGPYLISRLRVWRRANATVVFQSLWRTRLGDFDVAYAFLSPAPMDRLIARAKRDMHPGSLLISNSFWATDQPFDGQVEVNDGRKSTLFIKGM